MNECKPGLFGRRQHKFEARFDTIPVDLPSMFRQLHATLESVKISDETVKALATKRYICDVCVRCGEVIKRG